MTTHDSKNRVRRAVCYRWHRATATAVVVLGGLAILSAPAQATTRSDGQSGEHARKACVPLGLETTDYLLDVVSTLPSYFGLPAKIDIHRVRPVYRNGRCSHHFRPRHAAILVHGRTNDAVTGFDLQYADYSLMRRMARAGIDSFAFNQLGYGLSSRFGMDDPCNVSNSHDLSLLPLHPANQQNTFLVPNPLAAECDHTDHSFFTTSQAGYDELDQVLHHVQSTTGQAKVSLFAWSAGGRVAGGYLAQPDTQQNVANVVLLSSPLDPTSEPPPPPYPTWATGLSSFASITGLFSINPACAGQRDPNILAPLWASVRARDPLGAYLGKHRPCDRRRLPLAHRRPLGLERRRGGHSHRPDDGHQPDGRQTRSARYGDHALPEPRKRAEGHRADRLRIARNAVEGSTNPSGWGGPHTTVQSAVVEWMRHATYQGATTGAFHAKVDGTVVAE